MKNIRLGIYRHYKGKLYLVLGIAKHSETLETLVVYISLYENKTSQIWARPFESFINKVTVDEKEVERFKWEGEGSLI